MIEHQRESICLPGPCSHFLLYPLWFLKFLHLVWGFSHPFVACLLHHDRILFLCHPTLNTRNIMLYELFAFLCLFTYILVREKIYKLESKRIYRNNIFNVVMSWPAGAYTITEISWPLYNVAFNNIIDYCTSFTYCTLF